MTRDKILRYLLLAVFVIVPIFTYVEVRVLQDYEIFTSRSPLNLTIHDTGLEFMVIYPAPSGGASKTTVQQVLAELGIKLHPQDSIAPALETSLSSGSRIIINRAVFKRTVSVPFETLHVKDENLLYGREVVKQYGSPGLKEETYLLNINTESEEILEEKILKPATPKIIARGLKIVPTGFREFGQASWVKSHYGYYGYVAAHSIIKRGSRMLVTNLENSRQVVVKIIDWGPDRSIFPQRVIDLSPEAFVKLGVPLSKGIIKRVKVEEIE